MKTMLFLAVALVLCSTLNRQLSAAPFGTAFTYQGRLVAGANAANGRFDLTFSLYDALYEGRQVGNALTNPATAVTNGYFTVTLDFGNVFDGNARWLEIGVRTNGGEAFTTLSPRQPLTPAPYAVLAANSSNLVGNLPAAQLSGIVPLAQLPASVVTNNATAVSISGTFSGNGGGLTNVNARAATNGPDGNALLTSACAVNGAKLLPGSVTPSALSFQLPPGTATNGVKTIFNVRDYGTNVGTGSYSIDSEAIKAAFQAWTSSPVGGVLYFPASTYYDTNTYVLQNGLGGSKFKICGDSEGASIWTAKGIHNAVFFYGACPLQDITLKAGSDQQGFNIAFENDRSACCFSVVNVTFDGWGVGWYTDVADGQGYNVEFNNCVIGLKLVGYADGGFYSGRFSGCTIGAAIGAGDRGQGLYGTNPPTWGGGYDGGNSQTHANWLHFEGSHNRYPYVVGNEGACTLGGYFEVVKDVVSVGYPPDVINLVPFAVETNTETYSVVVNGLGGFGGTNTGTSADSVVSIYTPAAYGIRVQNSTFMALDLIKSLTPLGDQAPVIIEATRPGVDTVRRVMKFSDGTYIPAWATLPAVGTTPSVTAEINSGRRYYLGTNLVNDMSSGVVPALYNTILGHTDPAFSSAPDADAVTFNTAASINEPATQAAVSKLCKDLKAAGLWNKMYVLYPFVGGSATSCAVNLMANSAYNITWYGSPTFTTLGVTGNGSSQYGITHFYPSDVVGAAATDMAYFVYNETENLASGTSGYCMGVTSYSNATTIANSTFGITANAAPYGVGLIIKGFMTSGPSAFVVRVPSPTGDYRGLIGVQRLSAATDLVFSGWMAAPWYDNSGIVGNLAVPTNYVAVLGAWDAHDGAIDRPYKGTLAMAGICHGLSTTEWNGLRVISDNFNAILGRKTW
jgi:hypothetical protein